MNQTDPTTFNIVKQYGFPQIVTVGLLSWSVFKIVKLFKKFGYNMEPSVLLELVFLLNIPAILATTILSKLMAIIDINWLSHIICGIYSFVRTSLLADWCLGYLDKFVALYWSPTYKTDVTTYRASWACVGTKILSAIFTGVYLANYR